MMGSVEKTHDLKEPINMADYDTFLLFGAVYSSVDDAQADYETVKSMYYELALMDTFDAAVVQKRDDGKVKIVKKHEQPTRQGGWRGAGWGLAAGAVVALFPGAAIGGGLLAATTAGGATLGAVAGHVVAGMSRGDLKELGEHLDAGESGLIVAAATDMGARVEAALERAAKIEQMEMKADEKAIDADVAEAESGSAG